MNAKEASNMQGLTALSISDDSKSPEDLTDKDLCPFLSETKESVFQEPMDDVLWRAVKCHLRCVRASETEHAALETKGWVLFHVTFYEILKFQENSRLTELWPCGELHSDRFRVGRPRRIRESAMTVSATFHFALNADGCPRSSQYLVWSSPVLKRDLYTGQCFACGLTNSHTYPTLRAGTTCLVEEPTR
jgi:hypothetical protein